MIQFGTQVIVTNAFKHYYLKGNHDMVEQLVSLGNPKDGQDRVVLMDVPANLPNEPTRWQKFLTSIGLLQSPKIRGTVDLIESAGKYPGYTHEYLWRFNSDLNQRFQLLKKQCQDLLK